MGAFKGGGGGGPSRKQIGGWLISNKTTNTTQQGAVDGGFYIQVERAGSVTLWATNLGGAAAGSALVVEITVDGGSNWLVMGSVAVGLSKSVPAAPGVAVNYLAGALIGVRYISDASWTSTTVDPSTQVELTDA
jgi:hypothetical protein